MVMGSPLAFRHRANAAPAVWIKWGRIGTNGQELVEEFASEDETGQAEEGGIGICEFAERPLRGTTTVLSLFP
jgi:hypothetical protein